MIKVLIQVLTAEPAHANHVGDFSATEVLNMIKSVLNRLKIKWVEESFNIVQIRR